MIYQWHFPFCPNKYGTRKNTMTITETTTTISRKMRWNGNFDYCKIKWRRRKLPTKYIYRPRQIIWFNGQILVNANTFTFSWNNIPIFFFAPVNDAFWSLMLWRWFFCYCWWSDESPKKGLLFGFNKFKNDEKNVNAYSGLSVSM